MRSMISCTARSSCTDGPGYRTGSARGAGIIWRSGPRIGPRLKPALRRPVTLRDAAFVPHPPPVAARAATGDGCEPAGAGCLVGGSCRCWFLCGVGPPAVPGGRGWRQPGRCLSSCCRLAGTLAGRSGSCLAGGAGRVLAWRVSGTTGQALRNADPAERRLPSAQPGSWCVLPHRGCNRN
jgi:hypothetical protein